jgi:hypothetical protein
MLLFNVCYVSAHKSNEKDALFQASISRVVEDHVRVKMKKGNIRRWSYEVGFREFSQNLEYADMYNYFKDNIANILAEKG